MCAFPRTRRSEQNNALHANPSVISDFIVGLAATNIDGRNIAIVPLSIQEVIRLAAKVELVVVEALVTEQEAYPEGQQ